MIFFANFQAKKYFQLIDLEMYIESIVIAI